MELCGAAQAPCFYPIWPTPFHAHLFVTRRILALPIRSPKPECALTKLTMPHFLGQELRKPLVKCANMKRNDRGPDLAKERRVKSNRFIVGTLTGCLLLAASGSLAAAR